VRRCTPLTGVAFGIGLLPQAPIVSVVDDDKAVRTANERLVRSLGYRAQAFASAEEFLASSALAATDCLIADIQMPGMNGMELQQALAAKRPELPIIFVTAFPEDRIRKQVMSAGAICMLDKPCDGAVLVNFIRSALSA
jgi:FixJ family two-component response regulator